MSSQPQERNCGDKTLNSYNTKFPLKFVAIVGNNTLHVSQIKSDRPYNQTQDEDFNEQDQHTYFTEYCSFYVAWPTIVDVKS